MTTRTIPAWIRAVADDLEDGTGQLAEITRLSENKWRITVHNDRVRLTMDYRRDGRGGVVRERTASTLQVDGKDRPHAHSFEHLLRIFHNPDTEEPVRTLADPLPPQRPTEQAPIEVRLALDSRRAHLRKHFGERGAGLAQVGFDERRGRWVVSADVGGYSFRDFFIRAGRRWIRAPYRRHQIVVDGVDRTGEADQQLNQLFSNMVAAPPETDPDGVGQVGGPSSAASEPSKSRKGTIIRT